MDLSLVPAWVIYAATGGVLGVVLAAIGYGLQRSGMPWGRFLIVGVVFFTAPITQRVVLPIWKQVTWSDAQTAASLKKEMPALATYLEAAFPEDFVTIVSRATEAVRTAPTGQAGDEYVATRVTAEMVSIRTRYAPFIKFAGDNELRNLTSLSIEFHQDILDNEGAAVCSEVAMEGAPRLMAMNLASPYLKQIDEQGAAVFKAIRSGMDAPVSRGEPTDEDWSVVGEQMAAMGATNEEFEALAASTAANPLLCNGLLRLLRALRLDYPAAPKVMASFFAESTAQ